MVKESSLRRLILATYSNNMECLKKTTGLHLKFACNCDSNKREMDFKVSFTPFQE